MNDFVVATVATLIVVGAAGCVRTPASGAGAKVETARAALDSKLRSPEGVVLEMATPVPEPTEVAQAQDVVVLGEPIPDEAIREFVFAFFDTIRRRDLETLATMVSEGAATLDGRVALGNRDAVISNQLQVMTRNPEYTKLAPAEIATADRLERFSDADLEALKKKKPEPMRPLDVLVRVAMPAVRGTTEKLFDDYVLLVLRPEGGKLKLVTKLEESASAQN